MKLLIWHENQRVPATLYGKAHAPGNYTIEVRATVTEMRAAQAREPAAIVYNFGGGGTGAGGAV